jgi:hypothetical protein
MPAAIKWTSELEQSIIDWISSGKTLREFCRQDGTPSHDAVYDHEKTSDDFKQRIARARETGEDVIAQECLEIADNGINDWVETKFGPQVNKEVVLRSKLRVDTRLKLLAKWNPRKYGDRTVLAGDPDNPLTVSLAETIAEARKRIAKPE